MRGQRRLFSKRFQLIVEFLPSLNTLTDSKAHSSGEYYTRLDPIQQETLMIVSSSKSMIWKAQNYLDRKEMLFWTDSVQSSLHLLNAIMLGHNPTMQSLCECPFLRVEARSLTRPKQEDQSIPMRNMTWKVIPVL